MKKCSCCGEWKVASTINFHRAKKGRYGLASECKECRNKKGKQYRQDNKEKRGEQQKRYYEANKDKAAERRKQYYEANKEKEAERHKRWYEKNKDKIAKHKKQYNKQYYKANRGKKLEYAKQYRENNKEKVTEYNKRWYEDNPKYRKQWQEANRDKVAEYQKQYRQSPRGQVVAFNGQQRRRIKEEEQGTGITKDQWLEMMNFFDWKCAYSGEYIGGKQNYQRTIDHIVPLNSGGNNMVWNMVPMLRKLNSSKNASNMEEWYREQDCYSEARLAKIYDWQEYAYNKWGKDTDYFNTNDIQIKLL